MKDRKLIYGCCVNDGEFPQVFRVDGKKVTEPIFKTWRGMIKRAYCARSKANQVSYKMSSTVEEWKVFSNFKRWMEQQNWSDLHLDKDLLVVGNKIYGPETCVFVPAQVNTILNIPSLKGGPLGVTHRVRQGGIPTYIAAICKFGKVMHVGCFRNPEDAHKAWQLEKASSIEELVTWYAMEKSFNTHVADALMARAWTLRLHAAKNIQTKSL